MSASPARMAAFEIVTRVRERASYAHETLDAVFKTRRLSSRDRSFATRLAYGTISARGTLDEAVARFVDSPRSLEPLIADALAVSAYEILFVSTPTRAAVNEGVELVKASRPRAAGFANAVLRRLGEAAPDFPWGDPDSDLSALARKHHHPEWLADRLVTEYGLDMADSIMSANNEPAPLYLAHLPFEAEFDSVFERLVRDGAEPSVCHPSGCILAGVPTRALASSVVGRKMAVVTDAGAQLAAHITAASGGGSIVELGAGRGTKSLIMAGLARLEGFEARITAVDTHRFKLDVLQSAASEAGATGISVVCADATSARLLEAIPEGSADAVLVDAPCSGLGTLRRHPDRRWRATSDEIQTLSAIGSRLLETASLLVKPGGFVVYSTCTVVRAENHDVVGAFMASDAGRGFSIAALPESLDSEWSRFVGPEGFFQSLPEVGGPDGHFIARLQRDC